MKKTISYLLSLTLLLLICASSWSPTVYAYFDQGPVGVSLGRGSVTLEEGETEYVSVSFSPSESAQLPGCGMAECPQTCGEKKCLDENGQCTCNGTTYQTYYAYATTSSSNTSVATASYDGGVIVISAVSPGTATITVKASLRQYSSTSASISVTVTAKSATTPEPTPTPTPSSTPAPASTPAPTNTPAPVSTPKPTNTPAPVSTPKPTNTPAPVSTPKPTSTPAPTSTPKPTNTPAPTGTPQPPSQTPEPPAPSEAPGTPPPDDGENTGVIGTPVGENTGGEEGGDPGEEETPEDPEAGYTVIESDRGTIYFVSIQEGKMGKDILSRIIGENSYVDFQRKDEAGNVQYAWEFLGTELNGAEDTVLTLDMGTTAFSGCPYGSASDSLYVSFTEDGPLPGRAVLYLRVAEYFDNGDELYLYAYHSDGSAELLAGGFFVENGYVSVTLESKGDLILSKQALSLPDSNGDDESQEPTRPVGSAETEESAAPGQEESSAAPIIIAVAAVVVILAAAAVLVLRRRKGHTDD